MALEKYLVHNIALETMLFCYKMSPHWESLACTSIINVFILNNMEDERQTVSFSEESKWNLPKIISMRSSFSPISMNTMNDSFLEFVCILVRRSPLCHFIWSCNGATDQGPEQIWQCIENFWKAIIKVRCLRKISIVLLVLQLAFSLSIQRRERLSPPSLSLLRGARKQYIPGVQYKSGHFKQRTLNPSQQQMA